MCLCEIVKIQLKPNPTVKSIIRIIPRVKYISRTTDYQCFNNCNPEKRNRAHFQCNLVAPLFILEIGDGKQVSLELVNFCSSK